MSEWRGFLEIDAETFVKMVGDKKTTPQIAVVVPKYPLFDLRVIGGDTICFRVRTMRDKFGHERWMTEISQKLKETEWDKIIQEIVLLLTDKRKSETWLELIKYAEYGTDISKLFEAKSLDLCEINGVTLQGTDFKDFNQSVLEIKCIKDGKDHVRYWHSFELHGSSKKNMEAVDRHEWDPSLKRISITELIGELMFSKKKIKLKMSVEKAQIFKIVLYLLQVYLAISLGFIVVREWRCFAILFSIWFVHFCISSINQHLDVEGKKMQTEKSIERIQKNGKDQMENIMMEIKRDILEPCCFFYDINIFEDGFGTKSIHISVPENDATTVEIIKEKYHFAMDNIKIEYRTFKSTDQLSRSHVKHQ